MSYIADINTLIAEDGLSEAQTLAITQVVDSMLEQLATDVLSTAGSYTHHGAAASVIAGNIIAEQIRAKKNG